MEPITVGVVVAYFIALLVVGWLLRRAAGNSPHDFWVAGGRTPFWLNFPAVISIYISGGSFLGIAGLAYSVGAFQPSMFILGAMLGIGLSVVLTGAQFRRAGAVTFADYMRHIFPGDRRIGGVAAILFGFYAFGYLVPQFQGGAVAFAAVLGLPFTWAVIAMGLVVVLYVSFGGFWAVTWTDALQGVLLFGSMLVVGILALGRFGGLAALWGQVQSQAPQFAVSDGALLSGIGLLVTWTFAWATFPAVVSRIFASQDEIVATRSLALGGATYAIFHLITIFIIAPAALLLAPGLENPDFALIAVIEAFLPDVLIGVVVAGLLSALMSSADSLLMGATSAVVHDAYVQLLRPETTPKQEVALARTVTLGLGISAVVATVYTPGIIGEVAAIVAGFAASALFFPMVLGTWWRGTSALGAISGMVAGAAAYLISLYALTLPPFTDVYLGIASSIVGTVGGSLLFREEVSAERQAALEAITGALTAGEPAGRTRA